MIVEIMSNTASYAKNVIKTGDVSELNSSEFSTTYTGQLVDSSHHFETVAIHTTE